MAAYESEKTKHVLGPSATVKQEPPPPPSLWKLIWKTVGVTDRNISLIQCLLYKLTLTFGPIIILTALLNHFSDEHHLSQTYLWLAVIGLFIFPVVGSLLFARCNVIMIHLAADVKALLISAIYRKVLVLSATERQNYSTGRIITMFSEDTNQIYLFLQEVHRNVIEPPVMVICIYLIYQQVGVSAFVGLGYGILNFLITGKSFDLIVKLRKKRLTATDTRGRLVNELLNGVRLIRLYGWQSAFIEKVIVARLEEVRLLAQIGYIFQSIFTLLMICSPNIQAIIIFAVYVYLGNTLTVTKAFTTLTLFGVMNSSFISLPTGFQQWTQAMVAAKRIMTFLTVEELSAYLTYHDELNVEHSDCDEERDEFDIAMVPKSSLGAFSSDSTDQTERGKLPLSSSKQSDKNSSPSSSKRSVAIKLHKTTLSWATMSNVSMSPNQQLSPVTIGKSCSRDDVTGSVSGSNSIESSRNNSVAGPMMTSMSSDSLDHSPMNPQADSGKPRKASKLSLCDQALMNDDAGIAVSNDIYENEPAESDDETALDEPLTLKKENSCAVYNENVPTLQKLHLSILDGELVAIVGNVGSGKSSFLASLMGEMNLVSGSICMKQNRVAYCEQTPWVINATVKENILLGSTKPYSEEDFQKAIYASGLSTDIMNLPKGVDSDVGEKGKTLSGGQRARISFARAVYSDAEIVLLDDPLSAVDAHVCKHMFHEGIVKVLAGRTRILVTHNLQVLPYCDRVIALEKNGKLGFVGSYEEFQKIKFSEESVPDMVAPSNVSQGQHEGAVLVEEDSDAHLRKKLAVPNKEAKYEQEKREAEEAVKHVVEEAVLELLQTHAATAAAAINTAITNPDFEMFEMYRSQSTRSVNYFPPMISRSGSSKRLKRLNSRGSSRNHNSSKLGMTSTDDFDEEVGLGSKSQSSLRSPTSSFYNLFSSASKSVIELGEKSNSTVSQRGMNFELGAKSQSTFSQRSIDKSRSFGLGSKSLSINTSKSSCRHDAYLPAVMECIVHNACSQAIHNEDNDIGKLEKEASVFDIIRQKSSRYHDDANAILSDPLFEIIRQRSASGILPALSKSTSTVSPLELASKRALSEVSVPTSATNQSQTPADASSKPPTDGLSQDAKILPRTYWSYITHGGVWFAFFTGFLICASQVVQIYSGFWLADWGAASQTDPSTSTTMFYLNYYAVLQVGGVLLMWLSRYYLISHRYYASLNFHNEMLNNLMSQEMSFFDITPMGQLLDRFSQDLITLDDDLTRNLCGAADLLATMLCALGVIIYTTQGLIVILLVPLLIIYRYYYKRFGLINNGLTQLEAFTRSPIYIHFSQTMLGLQSIRVYRCQQLFIVKLEEMIAKNILASVMQAIAIQWVSLRLSLIGALIIFAIGAIGVGFESKNLIAASYFAMALTYSIKLTNLLKVAIRLGASTESQFNSVQRVDEYCRLKSGSDHEAKRSTDIALKDSIDDKDKKRQQANQEALTFIDGALSLSDDAIVDRNAGSYDLMITGENHQHQPALMIDTTEIAKGYLAANTSSYSAHTISSNSLPFESFMIPKTPTEIAVEFQEVHMKYKYGPKALKGVTFKAKLGERIGIVGRTGCGKSSLIAALFQMEKLMSGDILIRGKSIGSMTSLELNKELCLIPQEPVMFSGTVRFNLDPLHVYSDVEIWSALTAVNMKGYVEGLAGKLNEKVGEAGDSFSAGQRQLICIARAVLRKPSILIMDEATAFMDSETDKFIQQTLRTYFSECTILTIAHRLHTIIDYDIIMVLDQGVVAEFDKPSHLIAQDEGIFKSLWVSHNSGGEH